MIEFQYIKPKASCTWLFRGDQYRVKYILSLPVVECCCSNTEGTKIRTKILIKKIYYGLSISLYKHTSMGTQQCQGNYKFTRT